MPLLRFCCVVAVAVSLGCLSTPGPHPRALENNEYCAQYLSQGLLDKAEVHCDLAIQFSPQYADLWVNKGLIAYRRGQNDKAKEHYLKALRYNNEQAQAYNNLGVIYRDVEQKLNTAHDHFQRALKTNPDYLEARYNLALSYLRMKKLKEARKEYETVIAINPQLADPHHDLGVLSLEEGKVPEAITHLKQATELDATYANAWLNLGNAYAEAGKYAEARDAFTSCLEAEPENAQCRNNVAIANRKAKLLDPTLKEIQESQAAENTAPSQYQLAQAFKQRGLRNEEERTYKKCVKIDGKYAPCHYGLFQIFREDRRDKDAGTACKNFLKFAQAEEFPKEVEDCEKFLSSST